MKRLETRLARLEKHVRCDEENASALAFDSDPTHYRLIVCRPPDESPDAALARWGLTREDVGTVLLSLAPCCDTHSHQPPMLLGNRRSGPATTRQPQSDLGALLQEALAQSEEERERQRKARWERDRETLRRLREQQEPT
jgi:hypothetical protein